MCIRCNLCARVCLCRQQLQVEEDAVRDNVEAAVLQCKDGEGKHTCANSKNKRVWGFEGGQGGAEGLTMTPGGNPWMR